ncbi:MAG TPA: hypothetical protein ENK47_04435 [Euryarchaeota archaeon]|nr:hypothetical protein [Euryarchaeota archaeon]
MASGKGIAHRRRVPELEEGVGSGIPEGTGGFLRGRAPVDSSGRSGDHPERRRAALPAEMEGQAGTLIGPTGTGASL